MKNLEKLVKALKAGSLKNGQKIKIQIKPEIFGESCVCTGTTMKESCMSLGPFNDSCLALGRN